MTRQKALQEIWLRLLIILASLLFSVGTVMWLVTLVPQVATDTPSKLVQGVAAPLLLFICGNVGSYLSIHRNISVLSDEELVNLSSSWLGLIVPSFVGGILALLLYLLFLSGIISGDIFPEFKSYNENAIGIIALIQQNAAEMSDYAKLLVWGFVAGFNQEYVIKIIESIKSKP